MEDINLESSKATTELTKGQGKKTKQPKLDKLAGMSLS
jgi:hypothetical protein